MPTASIPDSLRLSRTVLRGLIGLNILIGLGILAMLVTSFAADDWFARALKLERAEKGSTLLATARLVMVVGIVAVPLTHVVLGRLLALVESVRLGSPFVTGNAARLQQIARAVLGLELLHLAVGVIARVVPSDGERLDLDWSFSFTRWIAVLLLFVLTRVFDHGARMREDIEGTI